MSGAQASDHTVIVDAAKKLKFDQPADRLSSFCQSVLGRNAMQVFSPTELAEIAATLTRSRGDELFENGTVPGFVIFNDANKQLMISGLGDFLANRQVDSRTIDRLVHRETIRDGLTSVKSGHDLEAVAAAILDKIMDSGAATRGSGDQGIDAIGWSILFKLNEAFVEHDNRQTYTPDCKVFVFASSKKAENSRGRLSLISPAVIREIVGGWVIQRSVIGAWGDQGVKILSPVQMIFVTTYRLSDGARSDCKRLGVQVWGLPELIYLVAANAPDSVFDSNAGYTFSRIEFENWYNAYGSKRLTSKR